MPNDFDFALLCDGRPASGRDVSSVDWMEVREARAAAALCPDCQDKLHPLDVPPDLYGMGGMSLAHLYAVPVLPDSMPSGTAPTVVVAQGA